MRKAIGTARALGALAIGGIVAVVPALAEDGPLPPDLQEARAAVAKYHSFEQAARAGYSVEHEPCVASPAGTMGIHAINRDLVDDPAIDPLEPEILLYVPKGDGKLVLVGVEYMRIAADQNPADGFDESDKPSLFGRAFRRDHARPRAVDGLALRPTRVGRGGKPERRLCALQPGAVLLTAARKREREVGR